MKMVDSLLEILNDLSENIESTEQSPYEIALMNKRKHLKALKKKRWYKKNIKAIDDNLFDIVLPQEDAQHPPEEPLMDDDIFQNLRKSSKNDADFYEDDIDFEDSVNFDIEENIKSKSIAVFDKSEVKEKNKVVPARVSTNFMSTGKTPSLFECEQNLLSKLNIMNINGKLFYFNNKCYDPADKDKIIMLYRDRVDEKVNLTSTLHNYLQLEKFLITDSSLYREDDGYSLRLAVLNNCVYDVEKRRKLRHSPDIPVFSYIDANFINNPSCPYFDQFLKDTFHNNPILIKRVWMMLGYLFMQTNEAKAFFHMGEAPNSGKSLLGNFVQSVFPEKYVSNVPLHEFNSRFGPVRLVGSAVNISLDLPSTTLKSQAVSKIKMLTGGDYINVEEKCQPIFKYRNRAKLLFASNFPIRLYEDDDAFWNRLVYIPFDVSIPTEKQDRTLVHKFKKEKDSIVTKALYYAHELIKNDFIFPSTSDIDARIRQWKVQPVPTIDYFLKECCTINDEFKGELVSNLHSEYQKYCLSKEYNPKGISEFKQYLEKTIGLTHTKIRDGCENPRSAFRGIKLNSK